jgi:hypothetical protein
MGPGIERQCFGLISGLHIYTFTQHPLPFAPPPALVTRALTHMKRQNMDELSVEKWRRLLNSSKGLRIVHSLHEGSDSIPPSAHDLPIFSSIETRQCLKGTTVSLPCENGICRY